MPDAARRVETLSADLSEWAGQLVVLSLVTDSDGPFNCDWACWGEPTLGKVGAD